jgi:CBS domain-containing protein
MAKTKTLRDVMSTNVVTVPVTATVVDAAMCMKAEDIGDVLVMDDGRVHGILTDRDIVVRGVADDKDLVTVTVRDLCSSDVVVLSPDDSAKRAIDLMSQRAIRRIPVVEDGKPVGIVSIGDLAIERDSGSALADISSEPANN